MKRDRIWLSLLVIALTSLFLGVGSWGFADEEVTLIGTIEKTDRGVFLVVDDEKYLIIGQDLSALKGRQVKVTGEVIESRRGKSLKASIVEIHRG